MSGTAAIGGIIIFDDVKPGNYIFKASKTGYIDSTSNAVTISAGGSGDVTIDLTTEGPATLLRIKVVDPSGAPLQGANVRMTIAPTGQWPLTGTTNASGIAHGYPEVTGDYTFEVSKTGYETKTQLIHIITGTTSETTIILLRLAVVRVTVVDSGTNVALPGASITSTIQALGEAPLITGSDGLVIFTDVVSGSYTVSVKLRGYNNVTSGIFTVHAGDTKEITLRIEVYQTPTILRVHVTDEHNNPLNAAQVYFDSKPEGQPDLLGTTTSLGIFEFRDIKSGNYAVRAAKTGWVSTVENAGVTTGTTSEVWITLKPEEPTPSGFSLPGFSPEATLFGLLFVLFFFFSKKHKSIQN